MWLRIKVKDEKIHFVLELLKQLKESIDEVQVLEIDKEEKYFEIIDENGVSYKVPNWTDEEFEIMGLNEFFCDKNFKQVEELFDV